MSKTGTLIRTARTQRGLTIADLASVVHRSVEHIYQVERGTLHGTPETLRCIASTLGISIEAMQDAYIEDARLAASMDWNRTVKVVRSVTNKRSEIRSIR